MLPIDHDAAAALAALSSPLDHSAAGWTRRRFLQAVAVAGGSAAAMTVLPDAWREAWAAPPLGATDGVLVLIGLYGGNDGLNTVVPITNGAYYAKRGAVAIQPDRTLALTSEFGLHPNLPYLQALYQQGRVGIVNGVGYPDYNRSHFESMDIWMRGLADRNSVAPTGWIGRYLDGIGGATDLLQGVTFGESVPLMVRGATRNATALSDYGAFFGADTEENHTRAYNAIRAMAAGGTGRGLWGDAIATSQVQLLDVATQTAPLYTEKMPGTSISRQLLLAARLINANLGLRVICVDAGGYDNHSGEQSDHARLMGQLDDALREFWTTLGVEWANRVTMMTYSEFGREMRGNDSNGTDHGTANNVILIGPRVAGGMHGQLPDLANTDRYGQLTYTVDFRSVYATVLGQWLNADPNAVLGGAFSQLSAFVGGPIDAVAAAAPTVASGGTGGGAVPGIGDGGSPAYPPSDPGAFVGLTPFRLVDTRINQGATRLGPAASFSIAIAGAGTVPAADVVAVALNVTVTDTTTAGYLTVWPTGEDRPLASNLNFTAGQTVPNMVFCKLGADGGLQVYNSGGQTQVVIDVLGYFSTSDGTRLVPLSPARVIDTRTTNAPLVAGTVMELELAGVAGVPKEGADSVVLNLTVTDPTLPGFITTWPTGEPQPLASSLNFLRGQTVPNLVIAKLGGGKINLANHAGAAHVVADVVGYFATNGGDSRAVAVSPRRLLDTRTNNSFLSYDNVATLGVTGVDVPSDASAVVLNVTVTEPTTPGFVTVWPAGEPQPVASNLNFVRGQTVPNLVMAKIGRAGQVSLYAHSLSAHVVVDIVGFFR